jgi:hypothetical protein
MREAEKALPWLDGPSAPDHADPARFYAAKLSHEGDEESLKSRAPREIGDVMLRTCCTK